MIAKGPARGTRRTGAAAARPDLDPPRGLPRLLAGTAANPITLEQHLARWGRAENRVDLLELVDASGLTGRGGAGFPTGAKLRAVAAQRGRPVVVVNGAEGESASGKDKVLLRYAPHLVLDGAVLAASALGATEVIIAVARAARAESASVKQALHERARRRIDGLVRLRTAAIPNGFVVGEETAILNVLNGGPAKPTFTPPRPFERGVGRAPTLIQNAETLAHLALIARFGPAWFRELGTPAEPGSILVTLSGAIVDPGVYEVALGTPLLELVDQAGGESEDLRAILVGGYFGSWVDARTLPGLRLLDSDLRRVGSSLGARALVALPASACGVCDSARAIRYLAAESAGQCGPCVYGLAAIADGFEQIAGCQKGDPRPRLARWIEAVRGRGACRHPDGAARFVASALAVFGEEVEHHIRHKRCNHSGSSVLPLPAAYRR